MGVFMAILSWIRRVGSTRRMVESEVNSLWVDSINELDQAREKLRQLEHHLVKLQEVTEDIRMCDTDLRNKIVKL